MRAMAVEVGPEVEHEPEEWIVVGADVLRHPELPSNGAVEHPTECHTIDRADMDAEVNDPARALIHDDQDPMGPQRGRLAPDVFVDLDVERQGDLLGDSR